MKTATFAELIGVSESTIQSIELGPDRLKLSEALAEKISSVTDVSIDWLLRGDPKAPVFTRSDIDPYTKEHFEMLRGRKLTVMHGVEGALATLMIRDRDALGARAMILHLGTEALKRGRLAIFVHRVREFFRTMVKEFAPGCEFNGATIKGELGEALDILTSPNYMAGPPKYPTPTQNKEEVNDLLEFWFQRELVEIVERFPESDSAKSWDSQAIETGYDPRERLREMRQEEETSRSPKAKLRPRPSAQSSRKSRAQSKTKRRPVRK